jgi:hypothetical protein
MNASRPWAVVFGGPSPEHEISILTGLQAERVLTESGDTVHPIYWAPSGEWFLVPNGTEAKDYLEGAPKSAKSLEVRLAPERGFFAKKSFGNGALDIEAALLCFHGGTGEGGGAAALFDAMGIPATGSTLFAGAVGMDKLAFAGLMEVAGIPTLARRAVSAESEPGFAGPYIVKPRFGGSSIGIEIAEDLPSARALAVNSPHLKNGAVLEPYLPHLVDLASEANGRILAQKPEAIFLKATDFSCPIKASAGAGERVFELRTYTTPEGRLPALHDRFRNHTMSLFSRHGMSHTGYWTPTDPKDSPSTKLLYILSHASKAAGLKSFESFRADPEWIAAKGASETKAGGSLTIPQPEGATVVYRRRKPSESEITMDELKKLTRGAK